MSSFYRCTAGCETKVAFESRSAALEAGWALVEIVTKDRVKYHVLCPEHVEAAAWLRTALGDEKKKR